MNAELALLILATLLAAASLTGVCVVIHLLRQLRDRLRCTVIRGTHGGAVIVSTQVDVEELQDCTPQPQTECN